ncbi:putative RNA-directed DNA polymerase [Tanacetum coccineum]
MSTEMHWDWTSNGACCDKGTRIIVGWNHNDVDVVVITQDAQAIHTRIWLKAKRKEVFCSFIYAHNRYTQRHSLWRNLSMHKLYIRDRPWCLLGDFNATLFLEDSTASGANIDISMREFRDCVEEIEVMAVHRTGLQFTWNQKPKGANGILKKLDRIMANMAFNDQFVGAHAIFRPYRVSDHSPFVLYLPTLCKVNPKPFKFFNVVARHERFMEVVKELLYEKGNLHANVIRLRTKLDSIKTLLDADPFNASLREAEAACVVEFNQAAIMEERFLKQKAKINWLKEGNANSAYFHKTVKSRVSRSRIDVVTNAEGVVFANDAVPDVFVSHYEAFLGLAGETHGFNTTNLFKTCLNEQVATDMIRNVTTQEVKEALFSMGDDKSPGPDGYTACFFKTAWDVVADDVTNAICEFFRNGNLLKELNHTIIALIPKVKSPTRVNDYRPISCCNVLFKCISKIIANRIKHSLKILISPNQSTFIPGRSITDNILLTQELMHNYHLDRGTPRCAFKVDIQKAYDTVDWEFLHEVLHGFGFHARMIAWIMECVTTTSYSICVNGSLHGYFRGKRGLRQGDPLSPYLYCSKLELINLCFVDDLFLFAYGDVNSASIIKEALEEFKDASGLTPSLPKSTTYFCNVLNHIKLSILQILPFEEGKLPVKYLGVPLVSSRLMIRDCNELLDRVQIRIQDWKNKSLSVAGRLQLIRSVLGAIHIYWASVFIIPSRVLLNIEQLMRGFLWCHGSLKKGKSKVAWEVVCLPRKEGGLGIRRLEVFNSALMIAHVWKLLSLKESLWVKWVHEYKLKGHSFLEIPLRGNVSWGWRKILQLRPIIRNFIWYDIGDGTATSLWFDKWCELGPLSNSISSRDIFRAGLTLTSKVRDVYHDGTWSWPQDLLLKYPFLTACQVPIVDSRSDGLLWRTSHGVSKPFSVAQVWFDIRPRGTQVDWYHVVWFASCIPRHAFNLWLVVRRKLKMQDLVSIWDVSDSLRSCCSLCDLLPIASRRSMLSVVAKLVVAASAYFIFPSPILHRGFKSLIVGVLALLAYYFWIESVARIVCTAGSFLHDP